jgi:membrane protein implicated in regulation of membrane protease activity
MALHMYWIILALVLLGVEMATGTFYMLVLSLAIALGGLVALAGWALSVQMAVAGLAAVIGTLALRLMRDVRQTAPGNNSPDIGQMVRVLSWNADGTARVHYRGADWDAELESGDTPSNPPQGVLYIKATQGSKLILTQHKS